MTPKKDKAATEQSAKRESMAAIPPAAPALADEINTGGDLAAQSDAAPDDAGDSDTELAHADVELVAMRRDAPLHENGPVIADVHPDEVGNWLDAGWIVEAGES